MVYVITVLRKIDKVLAKIAKILTAVVLGTQMLIITLGVIFRYFLNSPLTWIDELSCYLLIFTTFIGGYVALRDSQLARVDFFVEKFSPRVRKSLKLFAYLTILVFSVAIVYYGVKLAGTPIILKQFTPSMRLPMIVFFSFIPFSGVLMLLDSLIKFYDEVHTKEFGLEKDVKT